MLKGKVSRLPEFTSRVIVIMTACDIDIVRVLLWQHEACLVTGAHLAPINRLQAVKILLVVAPGCIPAAKVLKHAAVLQVGSRWGAVWKIHGNKVEQAATMSSYPWILEVGLFKDASREIHRNCAAVAHASQVQGCLHRDLTDTFPHSQLFNHSTLVYAPSDLAPEVDFEPLSLSTG